jgi:hypothetical protein
MPTACEECPYRQKILDIEKSLERLNEKNEAEHKDFYEKIHGSDKNMAVIIEKIDNLSVNMSNTIQGLKDEISAMKVEVGLLKAKPEKRFDLIINTIVTAIVAGLMSFLLFKWGLK